ncbi:unnamed protein product [Pleuronectes platessa]|uniref:Secreted protein n=1 Tax=Pleuronectes platessa TaxID=8262 RepID=A0A9N7YE47_PLEPL|nr:unnamed protein product [Pleuronectes platessa]
MLLLRQLKLPLLPLLPLRGCAGELGLSQPDFGPPDSDANSKTKTCKRCAQSRRRKDEEGKGEGMDVGSVCGTGRSSSGGTSRRRRGRRGGDWVRSAAPTLDACRTLLADHLSYGDRWGNPPAGA